MSESIILDACGLICPMPVLKAGRRLREVALHADRGRSQPLGVTVSIGVGRWHAGQGGLSVALDQADQALYDAKRGGRNRSVAYSPSSSPPAEAGTGVSLH